jgi:ATP-dependent DNA helicase RecQ
MTTMDYRAILKEYWGYDDFRGVQEDIVSSIGEGRDTLGLMPTGGGKSVTFQVPAMAKEGVCIVVTPLIALMKDQVDNLRRRGIKAVAIHSGMRREEIIVALENCIFGAYKFLYISPERLATDLFRTKLAHMHVNMLAIDEAHCISQWGYDFRPSYLKIAEVRDLLPDVPVLALTATATPIVVEDICRQLRFRPDHRVFRMSFERKNLVYVVRRVEEEKEDEVIHILKRVPGSAIVYTRSRQKTAGLADALNAVGISAIHYHAGLTDQAKDERQRRWQQGEIRVMVATNAFGMGIDKPDVRTVIHVDIPDSPEAYFQEAGRAGRDGQRAYAVLLYTPRTDQSLLKRRVADAFPPKEKIRQLYDHVNFYLQMAMGDGLGCTFAFDLQNFCTCFHHFPTMADSALKILTRAGYVEYTEEQDTPSRVQFLVSRDELYRCRSEEETDRVLALLMRSYTGIFADYVTIHEEDLARQANLPRRRIYEILLLLARRHILQFIPGRKTPYLIYTRERQEASRLIISHEVYEDRKRSLEERIQAMLRYVSSEGVCRSRILLEYFGEKDTKDCGQCDVCLQKKGKGEAQSGGKSEEQQMQELSRQIQQALAEGPTDLNSLEDRLQAPPALIRQTVQMMLSENIILSRDKELYIEPK